MSLLYFSGGITLSQWTPKTDLLKDQHFLGFRFSFRTTFFSYRRFASRFSLFLLGNGIFVRTAMSFALKPWFPWEKTGISHCFYYRISYSPHIPIGYCGFQRMKFSSLHKKPNIAKSRIEKKCNFRKECQVTLVCRLYWF